MYLSSLGFFNKKKAIEQQQLMNYLNLLTRNLKNNNLQLAYLQQGLRLLKLYTASIMAVKKQKRLAIQLKFTMRKRRKAKKRLILRNSHRVESLTMKPQKVNISPQFSTLPQPIMQPKPPKNRSRVDYTQKI